MFYQVGDCKAAKKSSHALREGIVVKCYDIRISFDILHGTWTYNNTRIRTYIFFKLIYIMEKLYLRA